MKKKLGLNSTVQRLDATCGHHAFPSSSGYSASYSMSYSDAWRHFFHLRHVRMLRQFSHPQTGVSGGLYVFKRWILPIYFVVSHHSISGPFFMYQLFVLWTQCMDFLKAKGERSFQRGIGRTMPVTVEGLSTTLSICLLIPTWSVY